LRGGGVCRAPPPPMAVKFTYQRPVHVCTKLVHGRNLLHLLHVVYAFRNPTDYVGAFEHRADVPYARDPVQRD
jgi:hypothetical protein